MAEQSIAKYGQKLIGIGGLGGLGWWGTPTTAFKFTHSFLM